VGFKNSLSERSRHENSRNAFDDKKIKLVEKKGVLLLRKADVENRILVVF